MPPFFVSRLRGFYDPSKPKAEMVQDQNTEKVWKNWQGVRDVQQKELGYVSVPTRLGHFEFQG